MMFLLPFGREELDDRAMRGLVASTPHPADPDIVIYNYTARCVYSDAWDPATLACRGLILNRRTGEIVALPFPKFFNWNEPRAFVPEGVPEVTVKLDGSLGILYRLNGKLLWATRGSFTGEQARAAQALWDEKHAGTKVPEELTLLAEIIHPITRVVVDYNFQDLVLVGARDRFTGRDFAYPELEALGRELGMRVVERVGFRSLAEAADAARRMDARSEGFVLRWPGGHRLKVKSPEYLRAWKVVHGMDDRALAKAWAEGKLAGLLEGLPEELRAEAEALGRELDRRLREWVSAAEAAASGFFRLRPGASRKEVQTVSS